jgi:hypothetical protein
MSRTDKEQNDQNRIPENDPSKAMDSKREVEESNDAKTDQDFPGYPHYPSREDIMDQRTGSHRVDEEVERLSSNRNDTGFSQRFTTRTDRADEQPGPGADSRDENDFSDLNPRTEISRGRNSDALGSTNAEIGIPQNADNDDLNKRQPGTDLGEETDAGLERDSDADVTPEERQMLENISMPTRDEDNLRRSALDNTDFDGDELNEDSFGEVLSSVDLDIPDEADETDSTAMGQGDEENKYYSLGGDRHEAQEEDPYSGPVRGDS